MFHIDLIYTFIYDRTDFMLGILGGHVGSCVYVIGSGSSPIKFRDSSQASSY